MRQLLVVSIVAWVTPCLGQIPTLIPQHGTTVSGVAYFHPGSDAATTIRQPVPGVTLYCAWGSYGSTNGAIIARCDDIWGNDCTSGSPGKRGPRGLFHFHHPDVRAKDPAISLMHLLDLDEELQACNDPASPKGRFFSRWYTPVSQGQGHSVKAEFTFHPTYKPFRSADEAAHQTAQTIAVRYAAYRQLIRQKQGAPDLEMKVRRDIAREVSIVFDLLPKNDRPQIKDVVSRLLSKMEIRDLDMTIRPLEWLPVDGAFWFESHGASVSEVRRWEGMRALFEQNP